MSNEGLRKVFEVQDDRKRKQINFRDLKKGMRFELFEDPGGKVVYRGDSVFTALSDAYLNENGVWEVQTQ